MTRRPCGDTGAGRTGCRRSRPPPSPTACRRPCNHRRRRIRVLRPRPMIPSHCCSRPRRRPSTRFACCATCVSRTSRCSGNICATTRPRTARCSANRASRRSCPRPRSTTTWPRDARPLACPKKNRPTNRSRWSSTARRYSKRRHPDRPPSTHTRLPRCPWSMNSSRSFPPRARRSCWTRWTPCRRTT